MQTKEDVLIEVLNPPLGHCTTFADDILSEISVNPSIKKIEKAMDIYAAKMAILFYDQKDKYSHLDEFEAYENFYYDQFGKPLKLHEILFK